MSKQNLSDQYLEKGYLVLENVFDKPALDALRQASARIVENFDPGSHRSVFSTRDRDRGRDEYFMASAQSVHCFLEEDALDENGTLLRPRELAINKIGHAMHDLVPEFTAFCRQPIIARILADIGCRTPLLWQTMYIFKQPYIGGEVRWHQDASYLITQPASVVGFWVAIEDAHRENGCLWVQPGGHRSALREIYEVDRQSLEGTLRELDNTPWPSDHEAVAVEVPAGSLIVFHDHMPHYSSQNTSEKSRHAFTMHFAEEASHWSDKNWLQRPDMEAFAL